MKNVRDVCKNGHFGHYYMQVKWLNGGSGVIKLAPLSRKALAWFSM